MQVPCHVEGKCPSVETKTGWCPVPDKTGKVSGQNGQSCFWVRTTPAASAFCAAAKRSAVPASTSVKMPIPDL